MSKLPYLDSKFKSQKKPENSSNQLVKLDVKAFNAVEGLFEDHNGEYTIGKRW
ncbi:MAG: hypothetical protein ACJAS9_000585 [Polaribacter sp.]|jgi:hypothetical protein